MTKSTIVFPENSQKQLEHFIENATKQALKDNDLDQDGIQKLLKNGNDFRLRLSTLIRELSVSNQFADEQVESRYGYLSGYQPKGIVAQIARLRELFPKLGSANVELTNRELPPNAEGWFAIPRAEVIAPTYSAALEKVFALIRSTRDGKFYNGREGNIDLNRLQEFSRAQMCLKRLGNQQEGYDILIVPAQFGLRHRGKSVRRAREIFTGSEFGLGAFAAGIMLLTHPERLKHHDDLWIDCAGDEYDDPDDNDRFSRAPCFYFRVGRIEFNARWVGNAGNRCGSASGFMPE